MATNIDLLPQLAGTISVTPTSGWYDAYQFAYPATDPSGQPDPKAGQPVDITGIDFRLQVRQRAGERVMLDVATANSLILVDGPLGQIRFAVPKDQPASGSPWHMAALTPGSYQADLVASADGWVKSLCQQGPLAFVVGRGITDVDEPVT